MMAACFSIIVDVSMIPSIEWENADVAWALADFAWEN